MTLNCPHCRIAFDTDLELEIHNMSLGHHVQIHKMGHAWHSCPNCNFSCNSLSEYSQHASSEQHRQQVKMRRAFLDYVREDDGPNGRLTPRRDQQPRENERGGWRDYSRTQDHRHREYPPRRGDYQQNHQRDCRRDGNERRWEQQEREQGYWIDRGGEFPRYPRGILTGERREQPEGERRENEDRRERNDSERRECDRDDRREPVNTENKETMIPSVDPPEEEKGPTTVKLSKGQRRRVRKALAGRSSNAPSQKDSNNTPPVPRSLNVLPRLLSSQTATEKNTHASSSSVTHRKRGPDSQSTSASGSTAPSSSSKAAKEAPKQKAPCVVITKIAPAAPKKNWEKMVSISAATQRQAERQAMARKRRYVLLDPNASDETPGTSSVAVPSPSPIRRNPSIIQSTSTTRPEPSCSPPTLLPFDVTPPPQRDPIAELNDTLRQVGSLCQYTLAPVKPKKPTPANSPSTSTAIVKEESDDIQIIDEATTHRERELLNLTYSQGKIKGEMDALHQEQYKLQSDFEAVDKVIGGLMYTAEVSAGGGEINTSSLAEIGRKSMEFFKLRNKVTANHAQVYKLSLELKAVEDKQTTLMSLQ